MYSGIEPTGTVIIYRCQSECNKISNGQNSQIYRFSCLSPVKDAKSSGRQPFVSDLLPFAGLLTTPIENPYPPLPHLSSSLPIWSCGFLHLKSPLETHRRRKTEEKKSRSMVVNDCLDGAGRTDRGRGRTGEWWEMVEQVVSGGCWLVKD